MRLNLWVLFFLVGCTLSIDSKKKQENAKVAWRDGVIILERDSFVYEPNDSISKDKVFGSVYKLNSSEVLIRSSYLKGVLNSCSYSFSESSFSDSVLISVIVKSDDSYPQVFLSAELDFINENDSINKINWLCNESYLLPKSRLNKMKICLLSEACSEIDFSTAAYIGDSLEICVDYLRPSVLSRYTFFNDIISIPQGSSYK